MTAAAPTRATYTAADVAELLEISPCMVRKLFREGKIPGRRIGGVWRVHRGAFDAWVAAEFGNTG